MNLQPSALETDALPLSYSPKELEHLDALICGYTSAVTKEADVYPFSWNVARVFRKNSRLALLCLLIAGCWRGAAAPPEPPTNTTTAAHRPDLPEVAAAEAGTWDRAGMFHVSDDVPLAPGQVFGWRLYLPCTTPRISYQEEMKLPAPGDWATDPDIQVSYDGRSVTVHGAADCTMDGWIEKRWSVAPGDPAGPWAIKVTAAGYAAKTFRVTFAPPLVPVP